MTKLFFEIVNFINENRVSIPKCQAEDISKENVEYRHIAGADLVFKILIYRLLKKLAVEVSIYRIGD